MLIAIQHKSSNLQHKNSKLEDKNRRLKGENKALKNEKSKPEKAIYKHVNKTLDLEKLEDKNRKLQDKIFGLESTKASATMRTVGNSRMRSKTMLRSIFSALDDLLLTSSIVSRPYLVSMIQFSRSSVS
ncbi:hypothetical protein BG006_009718 [Podila minutissima]|uniref:Uncharacterized protein n=1 Tax=Podila minutissima TaxID=64525 RepID=A0A9P5SHZ0_9FUNG|nr:hypothetical protein BG006_009718 [Podila minutissima]